MSVVDIAHDESHSNSKQHCEMFSSRHRQRANELIGSSFHFLVSVSVVSHDSATQFLNAETMTFELVKIP